MEISSLDALPVLLRVDDRSQVGEVRRVATGMAGRLGLDEQDQGRVALVLTEALNNAVKHGGGGEVVLRPITNSRTGVEALIVDKGPGIDDIERALRDGYSTTGTPGTGLGAVARLADTFDIYSAAAAGTALLVRVWARKAGADPGESVPHSAASVSAGTVCLPKSGETECGDAWGIARSGDRVLLIVADGLGHGPDAAAASREAIRVFRKTVVLPPAEILAEI